ncbi:DUF2165 family protein [Nocardia sp. R7R-8]|uniref:DUF2165 family protein n=1 Tax=Nocardia sp. R7R-8 TaxID=3459304 RepID=UPI00403D61E3
MAVLLFAGGFLTIGGEWFRMWANDARSVASSPKATRPQRNRIRRERQRPLRSSSLSCFCRRSSAARISSICALSSAIFA